MIFHSYVSLPDIDVVKTQIKTIHKITIFLDAIKKIPNEWFMTLF